ncbi:hypothetical protein NF556_07970 [Ornithinimicrobium faecis]|uniref:Uncharacterized protein n=1 Tax=Ornithinimicrobium faecis TaxID=2934158 RepID=A0ABY4YYP4_9MICO|nr:hypothetical protein [Ornithinimicrobium sp. HY1793]USQ81570.1 hypothetical protein NF556_07970 [Ornithinimicrobium sp. HY1793]
MSEAEEMCVTFVRAWAESTIRQVQRVREIKQQAARLNRQLDREWDRDLATELEPLWRQNWTEEHSLIWALHQLERWTSRLARERGIELPEANAKLRDLRNALEHLDEAVLENGHLAEAGEDPQKNRSLRRLPGASITIATSGRVFGTFDLQELEVLAREQFERMEDEAFEREEAEIEAAIDSYVDDIIAARRELR